MLTENVLQEFRRDNTLGVGGALENKVSYNQKSIEWENDLMSTHVVCLEFIFEVILDETCDDGRLKVILVVPSSGCRTVLFVNV